MNAPTSRRRRTTPAPRQAKPFQPKRAYSPGSEAGSGIDHLFQAAGGTSATFLVEVDGAPVGRFSECQGLEVELSVETFEEGGVHGFVHKLPGRLTWPNLVLTRGTTWDNALFEWFNRAAGDGFVKDRKVVRETVAVTLLSSSGKRLRGWNLFDAMPVKWTGPDLSTGTDEVTTERLEVAHHGFEAVAFDR